MALVIRAEELEKLSSVIRGDSVETIAVVGSEGCGKSALMTALAQVQAVPTKIVRGHSAEASWPYSGLSSFLTAIDELQGTNLLATIQHNNSVESAFSVATTLSADLRRAHLTPFAIIIDDVDVFDSQSQEVLGFLFRRNFAKQLRTVMTLSEVPVDGPFSTIPKLLLEDMNATSLFELGRSLSTPLARDAVLESITAASFGNPLAYKSILRAMPEEALNGDIPLQFPLRPGSKLARTVAPLLSGLTEEVSWSLKILSCAYRVSTEAFDQMTDASSQALDELIALGHVYRSGNELEIRDPRVRTTVYWEMSDGERRRLHEELADLTSSINQGQAAWHRSFVNPSEGLTADLLAEAAALVHRGLNQPAIELAERVLTTSHLDLPLAGFIQLLEPLVFACEFNVARRYLQIIHGKIHPRTVSPDLLRLRVLVDFAQTNTIIDQRVSEVVDVYKDEQPQRCAHLLAVTGLCHLQRWELDEASQLATRGMALDAADSTSATALCVALALFRQAFAGDELPGREGIRQQFDAIRLAFGTEVSLILIAQALSIAERYADARNLLDNVIDRSAHLPNFWIIFARHAQFMNEHRAGDYHQVSVMYDLLSASYRHPSSFVLHRSLMTAVIAGIDGDSTAAIEALRRARRLVPFGSNSIVEGMIAVRYARVEMHDGNFDAANSNFSRAAHLMSDVGSPHLLRFHDDYIESLVYSGDASNARTIYEEFVEATRAAPSKWAVKAAARSHALLLKGDESLEAFAALLRSWTGLDHEYLRARTFFSYSRRLKHLGYDLDSNKARIVGQEIFREIGIGTFGSVRSHDGPSHHKSVFDLLNDKETSVVNLLTKGRKNQTIARELFISVRTVELRLTNIYRKVGVKSRFELMKLVEEESSKE